MIKSSILISFLFFNQIAIAANKGFLLGILFAKKIKPTSYQCTLTEQHETEKELKEAKKWTGKFIFGLTDESCAL